MFLKKTLGILLASTLLLSACAKPAPDASSTAQSEAPTTSEATTEKPLESQAADTTKSPESETVTVWIPGDETEYKFYFDMFASYKAAVEKSGGKFEYVIEQQPWDDYWTKLPLEVNEGRGPDMFLGHAAYMDVLLPISRTLELQDDVLSNLKIKGVFADETGKDKFLPTVLTTYVMFANTELAGDKKEYPKTWDELRAAAKEAKGKNDAIVGFDYSFNILSDLMYQNNHLFTKDGKAAFEATELDFLAQLEKDKISDYFNFGNGSPEESFNQNVAAYIHGATWMEFWAPAEMKGKMKAFPVPENENASKLAFALCEPTFGINKNVSDEKAKLLNEIVKFMVTDEATLSSIVKGNSGIPNNKNITVTYEPLTAGDAVVKSLDGKTIALAVVPKPLENIYKAVFEKVLTGESTQTVLEGAKKDAETVSVEALSKMEDQFR